MDEKIEKVVTMLFDDNKKLQTALDKNPDFTYSLCEIIPDSLIDSILILLDVDGSGCDGHHGDYMIELAGYAKNAQEYIGYCEKASRGKWDELPEGEVVWNHRKAQLC